MNPSTAVMATSIRRDSINAALARLIARSLERRGESVDLIDLAEYDLPMYHGDLEAADGVPAKARELAARLNDVESLVIVSPEYNGSFPALLKNTVDWLTRADRGVIGHLHIHLASASPGGRGGVRGLAATRAWLESMRATVSDRQLSVPNASLDEDSEIVGSDPIDVDLFLPAA